MDVSIKDMDEVWTSDEKKLGVARGLHFRPEEHVNPDELLYGTYVEVENFQLGSRYFVPADFLDEKDEESGHVFLAVPLKEVMRRTWERVPDFVAMGRGHREPLPATDEAAYAAQAES